MFQVSSCKAAALSVCIALSPTQMRAQDTVGWFDLMSPDVLMHALVTTGISMARGAGDLRYQGLETDLLSGRISLHSFTFERPISSFRNEALCEADADRIVVQTPSFSEPSTLRFRSTIDSLSISLNCLDPKPAMLLRALQMDRLTIPRADLSVVYDHASGGLSTLLWADMTDIATFTLAMDIDYVSLFSPGFDLGSETPSVDLSYAALTLDNQGGWERFKDFASLSDVSDAALVAQFGDFLGQTLASLSTSSDKQTSQRIFITSAQAALTQFLQNPQRLVVETNITSPVRITQRTDQTFQDIFAVLKPRASIQSLRSTERLNSDQLKAALQTPDSLSPTDRRRAGLAFLTGLGAPKNQAAAQNLLEPLAFSGDAEVAFALAQATQETHPEAAYGLALIGAKGRVKGSLSLASDLETKIDLTSMIEIQNSFQQGEDFAVPDFDSLAAMRKAALDRLTGTQFTRNYMAAFYMASFGAAAGDRASFELLTEIEDLMQRRGDLTAWNVMTQDLSNQVLTDWIARDMPTILGTE